MLSRAQLLRQQAMARRELAALAKLFPAAFKNGKPIVAVLAAAGHGEPR